MHNIDRTQREMELENQEFEQELEQEYEHQQENEGEYEGEAFLGALFGEAEQEQEQEQELEYEHEHEYEQEFEQEFEYEAESTLSEAQEMELASELLEVSSEAELEQFIGGLISRAARGVRNFARSPQGRALGGMLKGVARRALPVAGKAIGTYFGGPAGAAIGGALGNAASSLFELELEGLSHEDREFEVARQFVRLGAGAARAASRMPRARPGVTARRALVSSARNYAPGLARRAGARRGGCRTCGANRTRGSVQRGRPTRRGRPRGYARRGRRPYTGGGYVGGFTGGVPVTAGGYVDEPGAVAQPGVDAATAGGGGTFSVACPTNQRAGRWVRRGNRVVLLGL